MKSIPFKLLKQKKNQTFYLFQSNEFKDIILKINYYEQSVTFVAMPRGEMYYSTLVNILLGGLNNI